MDFTYWWSFSSGPVCYQQGLPRLVLECNHVEVQQSTFCLNFNIFKILEEDFYVKKKPINYACITGPAIVGKISKHYGVGHGSVSYWPLFCCIWTVFLSATPMGKVRVHLENRLKWVSFYHGPDISRAMVMWPPCWRVTE